MTNLDSILKSRDITLPTKVRLVKTMAFPVVMYGCESWTVNKAECGRIDAFELWCWRSLLRVPWTARRSNQSILKEISPGCSLEGLMLKLKLQYFGHLMRRAIFPSLPSWLSFQLVFGRHFVTSFSHGAQFSSVHLISRVWLFVTPWTTAIQASLSITNSWSLLKLMSIESVMPSNHLINCHPLLLLPSIFPSIRVFSSESALRIRWPNYWEFQLHHQSFRWIFRTDFL